MRFLPAALLASLLSACAVKAAPTTETITPVVEAYKTCSVKSAEPLANSPDAALDIAKVAAESCERFRQDVFNALVKENEGYAYAGQFAEGYVKSLKSNVMNALAATIMTQRAAK